MEALLGKIVVTVEHVDHFHIILRGGLLPRVTPEFSDHQLHHLFPKPGCPFHLSGIEEACQYIVLLLLDPLLGLFLLLPYRLHAVKPRIFGKSGPLCLRIQCVEFFISKVDG